VVTGWLTATGLVALACRTGSWLLERRRSRAWQKEWARVEPRWREQYR
jgi:hypothetical protein